MRCCAAVARRKEIDPCRTAMSEAGIARRALGLAGGIACHKAICNYIFDITAAFPVSTDGAPDVGVRLITSTRHYDPFLWSGRLGRARDAHGNFGP